MAKSAKDVFAETMSAEMIQASDQRAKELLEEYDTPQKPQTAESARPDARASLAEDE